MSGREQERFPCTEATVVAVYGEIDIATADAMRERLLRAAARSGRACVVVDLSRADFFDASAVRALMEVYRRLTGDGRHMVVAEPAPLPARVLTALRLHEIIEVYPLVEMALAHIQRPARR
ncbi:STAS domain-containing protein [Nocardiopsis trehalosi]|uniref:STAS domain-containing protein n=1 Tax=Nocardiopsis trehalosi TaxID=109329 RepID=UPI000833A017|nr:STAS domain-containing protein [Nocardiopsis trehalosi]